MEEREKASINKAYLVGYVSTIVMGSFIFGYSIAQYAPLEHMLVAKCGFIDESNSGTYYGLISALGPGGALVGSLGATPFLKFGKRYFSIGTSILAIISAAFSMIVTYETLCISRFLLGMSAGFYSVICPLYIREISPKEWSGLLTSMHQFSIGFGVLVTSVLGIFQPDNIDDSKDSEIFRLILLFPIIPAAINIILFFAYYKLETPKYSFALNKLEEAKRSLVAIYNDEWRIEQEMNDLGQVAGDINSSSETLDISSGKQETCRELFKYPLLRPVLIGCLIPLFQQTNGINSLIAFSNLIYSEAGLNDIKLYLSLAQNATLLLFNFVAALTSDKFGRKILLLLGALEMSIAFGLTGLLYAISGLSQYSIITIWLYLIGFGISWGPIVWVVASEIMPDKAMSIATGLNWIGTVVVIQISPIIVTHITYGKQMLFWVFSGFCLFSFFFIWIFLPETKGKSLAQIKLLFTKTKGEYNKVNGVPILMEIS